MRLKNRVAIITGAANGIGLEAAHVFVREGAKVVLADFQEEAGNTAAQKLKEEGYEALFVQVDVSKKESVTHLIERTLDEYGTIDILVNNAGITRDALLVKMTEEDFKRVLDVNVTGVFLCTQAVVPIMAEKGYGKIINTSSVSGVYGNVGQTNYAASKAAVVGMTKTWAKELGRKGIRVNAVAPGFIETGMVETVPEKVIESLKKMIPAMELGKPTDIANAYLYLASEESHYVNGTVLHVDGGIIM
ncbi:3-oxoacyl-[acyl-carrier-protein] reductase [Bacillus oleivorans]|uniref:3-oxoacyl-[acyl-carrier-protein] reductase n=1 Tax=Bacillus oleivorans TaxID=1448271 RepID=A0A285CR55_9BACI|nr:3-oxoacyl-ACP reductase FabG [Bacillus oleivorans]SNX70060.1 3-oxoacyl-[acyl-carrier-protein] reductase [Bacillus oleivorans]